MDYLKFGMIPSPQNVQLPMCLLCEQTFSNESMKPSRLSNHLKAMHSDKSMKDVSFFQQLRNKYIQRQTISAFVDKSVVQNTDGLLASYSISLLIAKAGKPHTIGEDLILPAIEKVITTVMHRDGRSIVKSIPLSNKSVARRIDDMANDVESTLCGMLESREFAIQIDESTLPGSEALVMAYVRFVNDGILIQDILFAKPLVTDTRGLSILNLLNDFLRQKAIPLANIVACASDGAPAMVGKHRGFLAHLKQANPDIFTIHCVIHRQHLVAKNLSERLHTSLNIVVKAINFIKSHALNDRLFRQLCADNDEEFKRLLLHTEVRWLSKGMALKRFFDLYETVVEFLAQHNPALHNNVVRVRLDMAYMTDYFAKFNEMNLQLQGQDNNLIKSKSLINAFICKLALFKSNLARGELCNFPSLREIGPDSVKEEDLIEFCAHLEAASQDMKTRFEDLLLLDVPQWAINPFKCDVSTVNSNIQEKLIDLTCDLEAQAIYTQNGYQQFWINTKIVERYQELCFAARNIILAFPTSYLVEKGFSAVNQLVTKQRNRLQVWERGDLRLLLTDIEPNIGKLVANHQAHPSH